MKILFIQPEIGHKKAKKIKVSWAMEPLVAAQLKALTPKEVEFIFTDDRVEDIDFDLKVDIVAITIEAYTAKRAYFIASEFRKRSIKVIMGGVHATLCPEEVLEHSDSVMIGEAENIWKDFIKDMLNNNLQKVYKAIERPTLDGIIPDRSIYGKRKYFPMKLVETSRGCAFACDFCSVGAMYKRSCTQRPIEDVVNEIKSTKSKWFFFLDDNIGADINRAKELFKALKPLKIKWTSQISTHALIDEELVGLMRESGCIGALVGFESLNIQNLKSVSKQWNEGENKYQTVMDICRKNNLIISGTFLFGYDTDSKETFDAVLNFANKNHLYLVGFNQIMPFPGTPVYNKMKEEGLLVYNKWWLDSNNDFGEVVFNPKCMDRELLAQYCKDYKQKFYSFSAIIKRAFTLKGSLFCKSAMLTNGIIAKICDF